MKKSRTAPPWRFCNLHNRRTGLGEEVIPEEETAGVRQETFIAADRMGHGENVDYHPLVEP